jgi:uncharacterized protein with FMN-binding domain
MSRNQPESAFNPARALQKFVVSAFVVFTFVVYALHEHFTGADAGNTDAVPPAPGDVAQQSSDTPQDAPTAPALVFSAPTSPPNSAPSLAPTATPPASRQSFVAPKTASTPAPKPKGQYKDGTYTGPEIDAFYGYVRIKAVVQNGRIADVQFLEYPNDRRTSVRINNVAVPYLQKEAISAQSANVDFISGATLTSEAFAQSLQTALRAAKN